MKVDYTNFSKAFTVFSNDNASSKQVTMSSNENGEISLCTADKNSKIGLLARIFNMGSSRSENKKTGTLLENVLTAKYGQNTAFKAIKEVFGRETLSDGSRIGTAKIKLLLEKAKGLHSESKLSKQSNITELNAKFEHIIKTCLPEIGKVDANQIEELNERNTSVAEPLRKMLNAFVNAYTVTDGFVADSDSYEYLEAGVENVKKQLNARFDKLKDVCGDSDKAVLEAVKKTKEKCINLMNERLEYSKQIVNTNPVSLNELMTSVDLHIEAATDMFYEDDPGTGNKILDAYTKSKFEEDLKEFKPRLKKEIKDAFEKNPKNPKAAFKIIKNLPERMVVHIRRAIAQTEEGAAPIGKSDLVKMFSEHFSQILNKSNPFGTGDNKYTSWNKLEKDVVFIDPGKPDLHFTSNITPASKINEEFKARYGELGGISSHCSKEKIHAVNLAKSELKNKDGKMLFSGVRHGVNSAYDIENNDKRCSANNSRCEETVLAVLQQHEKLYEQALKGKEVELNITSIALLSPWAVYLNEREMLEDQNTAWNDIQSDGAKPKVKVKGNDDKDEEIELKIKVNVAKFNFAVHPMDVSNWRHASRLTGWSISKAMNREALEVLNKRYDDFHAKYANDKAYSKKMDIAKTLKNQINGAIEGEDYGEGNGPYRIPARIAVLSYIMGDPPCWNCKSGKDRTAQLDVECKYLAAEIERTGEVPELNAKIDGDRKTNYIGMALNSGCIEMQRYNVGVGGYKTKGHALFERLQRPGAAEFYSGASAAVGS